MVACLLTDKSTTIVPERKEINIEKCKDLSPAEDLIKKDLLQWGSEAMAIKTSLLILHVGWLPQNLNPKIQETVTKWKTKQQKSASFYA